ncbi:hypothetical protein Sango_2219100 [Sesamum angolense]|uniref:MHD2 domain-containing protein n=1 Tax=Sesamum angolense TaxID=2727404 RepID=A0AAE2BKL1_9LAMI|nr:hypothetical protein Sango_2219100 [Sesamum angolense]
MASLFRDRTLGHSKRDSFSSSSSRPTTATTAFLRHPPPASPLPSPPHPLSPLPFPFGDLTPLSDSDLRSSAYEIFLSANRSSSSRPLTYISNSNHNSSPTNTSTNGNSTATLQKSLTSAAASKMKKALGLRSSSSRRSSDSNNPVAGAKRRGRLAEEQSQMILPLELLQQFKASDFTDQAEYEAWQKRNLRMLEAALDRPIETGRNNESMQVLRTTVMALASRTSDGAVLESCHWADGFPLNLRLIKKHVYPHNASINQMHHWDQISVEEEREVSKTLREGTLRLQPSMEIALLGCHSYVIEPFLQELEHNLTVVADTVHERVRTCIIADIMRASFDGFLLVLLAGGANTLLFSTQELADNRG